MKEMRNRVRLIGNLGMEPEIKVFENNSKLAKFSLATSESYVDSNGNRIKETQWHNIVAWGKNAELVEKHLSKGNQVALEGKLAYRTYENNEGKKFYITEIILNEFLRTTKNVA